MFCSSRATSHSHLSLLVFRPRPAEPSTQPLHLFSIRCSLLEAMASQNLLAIWIQFASLVNVCNIPSSKAIVFALALSSERSVVPGSVVLRDSLFCFSNENRTACATLRGHARVGGRPRCREAVAVCPGVARVGCVAVRTPPGLGSPSRQPCGWTRRRS